MGLRRLVGFWRKKATEEKTLKNSREFLLHVLLQSHQCLVKEENSFFVCLCEFFVCLRAIAALLYHKVAQRIKKVHKENGSTALLSSLLSSCDSRIFFSLLTLGLKFPFHYFEKKSLMKTVVAIMAWVFLCTTNQTQAQSVIPTVGARVNGMANSYSCVQDEWSLFNNAGGLAAVKKPSVAAAYKVNPLLPGLNQMAAVVALPFNVGVTGIGFYRMGDNLYNEQIATAGFSNTFGITSLGATVNYIQYQAEGFGTRGVVSFSFGGITEINNKIFIGAFIHNLNQPYITEEKTERLPTRMGMGVGLTVSSQVFVTTEIEKQIDHDLTWKTGLEYKPVPKASFRTGFNVYPSSAYFGTGFHSERIKIDYAFQYSTTLNIVHQASVAYQLSRK